MHMTPEVSKRFIETLKDAFQTYMLAEDMRREAIYRFNLSVPNPNDLHYANALKRLGQTFAKAQTPNDLIIGIELARGDFVHAECVALLALIERELFMLNRQVLLAGERSEPQLADAVKALKQAHNDARRRWLHAEEALARGHVDESRRYARAAYTIVSEAGRAYLDLANRLHPTFSEEIRHKLETIRADLLTGTKENRFLWVIGLVAAAVLGMFAAEIRRALFG